MLEIDLDPAERKILKEVLENDAADLRMEISHTDRQDFRNMLKKRKEVLIKVAEAL